MHGAVGWIDNETECITMNNSITRKTQPSLLNGALYCCQWLRWDATNRKVAGSIPAGVIRSLIDIKPSDRTMALGSNQPLTEMSTSFIF